MSLPGSKFLFSGSHLSFKGLDGLGDGSKSNNEFLILGLDFSASGGEGILVETSNIGVESLDVGLEGDVKLGNLDKLSVENAHLLSEGVLVGVPGLKHLIKLVTDNLLVSTLGLSLTLSFRPFGQGSIEVSRNLRVLSLDDGEFVVHSNLLLL
mgnify:CR=1 FL=1